jgi:cysteine desulfurase / selenocysteine lyase
MDSKLLRHDFPILQRQVNGKALVYLDNAASSQKPRQVIEAISSYYYQHHANVHRGAHTLAVEATELYEAARGKLAHFIKAPSSESLVFTRNTTEALNLFIQSWGRAKLREGDEIIISVAEHHANIVPWHLVAERTGAIIKAIKLTPEHRLDLEHFEVLLSKRTKVVSIAQMSNVLGCVHPIAKLAAKAHEYGALMVVDGAQAAPTFR